MMRTGRGKSAWGAVVALAAAVVWCGGCAADRPAAVVQAGPIYDASGERRGTVFASPTHRALQETAPQAATTPWYAYRNDIRRLVISGYETPLIEAVTTVIHDEQSIHGDFIRDHYHNTSHIFRHQEAVR